MRLHVVLASLLAAALIAAGCGSSSSPAGAGGEGGADPAKVVPVSSLVYAEGVVRPEGDQKEAVDELIGRFIDGKDPGDEIQRLIDKGIKEEGKEGSYAEDIDPWLGNRIGVGVTNLAADEPGYIVAAAAKDTGKAEDFVKKAAGKDPTREYKGTTMYLEDDKTVLGVVGDYAVVAATEADFKRAVDSEAGKNLAGAERYKTAIGELPEERLGLTYIDPKGLPELARADPDAGPAVASIFEKLFGDSEPFTAALTATSDSATIESHFSGAATKALGAVGLFGTGRSTPLVRDAPEGSWAVLGVADVGASLKSTVETFAGALGGAALTGQLEQEVGINLERDVFSWVGDVAVFVRGASVSELNGGLVISATDPAKARAAFPNLVAAARRQGAPVRSASVAGAEAAFQVPIPGAPGPLVLARGSDRVVVAVGEAAAAEGLKPSQTIGDSGLYDRAKSSIDDIDPSLILDGATAVKLIEQAAGGDPEYVEAKPYLEMLDLVASGSEADGEALRSLFTVKVK